MASSKVIGSRGTPNARIDSVRKVAATFGSQPRWRLQAAHRISLRCGPEAARRITIVLPQEHGGQLIEQAGRIGQEADQAWVLVLALVDLLKQVQRSDGSAQIDE